uniref:Casein kinase II subunit beta n=1 Tax=Eucampia antarctica TaxID=49252 RepID=A0A7S2VYW6_9STRA|mmetsp:Transcript_140/g.143  ORF Transcript_140/g.143 Transcript_140/m.143 type:complete len:368 (+) Transcript_140:305-1408(+)|eukprot:CAMPEP_0197829520 /NCGR_PEP_ID=MMETSP1437-20131217/6011_1 /TAXON_ID=49252 ORGANISM="Eucampia antarctica, Strain CCMP1452" /NCGR_SAMPLE_ID=MMETSP1437 /ASSEMBLY_ACC=CAM_ASM_001096 /LENGTH=367 /DNA_ID=CAMNT_0043431269 /DNA_START=416 /DNA_END=1519 /DNA_ORIENTATION=+
MAYNDDSSASGHDEPWIQWFCGLKGHEMFCEVERSYIEDGFNLYGLRACVPNFSDCLDLILDRIGPDDSDDSHLTQSACTLYGLIHARYIITAHGLDAMYNKYAAKEFGTCPLIQCNVQPVLPVGLKDEMGADTVKNFCPKCQCVYHPPPIRCRSGHHGSNSGGGSGAVDGAAFGTTFPHLFLMTFNNLVLDGLSSESSFVPRVFGFRVHQSARQRSGGIGSSTYYASNHNRRGNLQSTKSTTSNVSNGAATGKNQSTITDPSKQESSLQVQNGTEDKTAAMSASAAAYQQGGNNNRSKGVSTPRFYKKGGDDYKTEEGKRGKEEEGTNEKPGSGFKRKSKSNDAAKNGDTNEAGSTISKRQKKPSI